MLKNVAAVVGDHVAAFELGVISEVFGMDRTSAGLPRYDFAVCAVQPGRIPSTSGFAIHVEQGLDRLATADLIAVPAWTDRDVAPPAPLVAALHDAVGRGATVLAVCSGAFLLAAAGMLDGRRAATHWQYAATLARRYPSVHVDANVLYVEDGPVVTSAGTAAAIDACLHLVRRAHGATTANALARRMVVPAHRTGGQAQFIQAPVPASGGSDLGDLLEWVRQHLAEPLTVDQLAARAHMSPRTFARRFTAATGTTPHQWIIDQRLLLAEHFLEDTEMTIEQIAARCGLGTPDTLRHHFTRRRHTNPSTYRRTFHTRTTAGA
ncbi:helix-turn-helix domain-containing protein [Micromonospora okii]|uniref:helix-turn-helix domain-containing protein n=1 Tax=Micromonospora okii TaxID=1182970 RepID=UPI001E586882|nr:helix-turn-helix domain-containing protein [Micromonospora okii]